MSAPIPVPPAPFLRLALDLSDQLFVRLEERYLTLADIHQALDHHGLDRSHAERNLRAWWNNPDGPSELCQELHRRGEHDAWTSRCDCANDVRAERSQELQMRVRYPQGGDW